MTKPRGGNMCRRPGTRPHLRATISRVRCLAALLLVAACFWVSACGPGAGGGGGEKVATTSQALATDAGAGADASADGLTTAPAATTAAYWQHVTPPVPSPRVYHAMAYDTARRKVVVFGGIANAANNVYLGDTWEWDGTTWAQRATTGPSPRALHAMAYDPVRGKVVLFGGVNAPGGSGFNDTWEWDGTSWAQRATTGGPSQRYFHSMAYDSARSRVVLFGGYNSGFLGDTWTWDGGSWTQVAVTGPTPRDAHEMAYDGARGTVVLFGGYNGGYLGDTWTWDGTSWAQRATTGPLPRYSHSVEYDSARSKIVLFGGYNGGALGDTWEWDGISWTQRSTTGSSARYGQAMAYDAGSGKVVRFGGDDSSGSPVGDTWEWDGTGWTQFGVIGPQARDGAAMAYDSSRNRAVLFGGYNGGDLGDTWEWDGTSWTSGVVIGPSSRSFHAMVYDSDRKTVVLFGGNSNGLDLGDTWERAGTSWTQRSASGPSLRGGHAMAYDSDRKRVVLFGGYAPLTDTWEWDGTSWTQRATAGPSARYGPTMAYDSARKRVVLFGGYNAGVAPLGDTWEWDGTSWTQRIVTGPSPRDSQGMVYDSSRGKVVLFGGVAHPSFLSDTWEWDGTNWTQPATTGPSSRFGHAMAYDSTRKKVVLFGGYDNAFVGDTWETVLTFGAPCTSTGQCASGSCVDGVCCNTTATSCGQCQACNVPGSIGTCAPATGGTCSDGNACMQTKTCQAGTCMASNPVVCAAADQCHGAGSCDPTTGVCSNPALQDGSPCSDDGNPCTIDSCQAGGCVHAPGNAGTVCRAAAGACDNAEKCDGTSAACPADVKLPSTTTCRASAGVCDVAETCDGTTNNCPADGFVPSTTTCRASAGVCDVAEMCTGSSAACPADSVQPNTTTCRAAAGACDVAEMCDGCGSDCPADAKQPSTTVCRASIGICDLAESCTGTTNDCPADAFKPTSTVCRASAGVCDVAESCTGTSAACPADSVQPNTTTCRAAAGACDVAEMCDGSNAACPADSFLPSTTTCRPSAGVCDVAEQCTGSTPSCPTDVMQPSTFQCRAPMCTSGTATQSAFCGSGPDCPAVAMSACGLFVCGASTCSSTCTGIDQCVASAFCSAGTCLPDNDPPVVTLGATPAFTNQSSLVVTGNVHDNGAVASIRLLLNGSPVGGVLVADASGNVTAPALTLMEGTNALTLEATDRAGNVGGTQAQVVLDTTPPVLLFQSPKANQALGMSIVDVAVQVTDETPVTVAIGGGPGKPAPSGVSIISATLSLPNNGVQTISASAIDAAGNSTTISESILIDLSAPDVTIDVVDGAKLGPKPSNLLAVTIRVNDIGATTLTLSTGGSYLLPRGGGIVQTTVPLVEGTESFLVNVTNEVQRAAQLMRTVVYDVTPPTGTIVIPADGSFARGTIELSADATDALTGVASVTFQIDGASALPGAAQSNTSSWMASFDTKTLLDGSHTDLCTLVDGVGNQRLLTNHFVIDNTIPAVAVTPPGAFVRSLINLTATASDATSGVASLSISVNGTTIGSCPATTCTLPFDTATLADGAFNITAEAVDGAGNRATSAQVSPTAVNSVPAKFIVKPVAGTIFGGSSLTVAVNVTDVYFASVECLLNGASLGVSNSPTFSQTVSLATVLDGISAVTCNVHDKAGNIGTQLVNITVKRWEVEVRPREINLRGRGGSALVEVEGSNVSILLPIAGRGLSLVVPGGSPVPALRGAFEGKTTNEVRLEFDRTALVESIEAGIALGKINPRKSFAVQLYAGSHQVGADLMELDR
jgi:hypothetical protein